MPRPYFDLTDEQVTQEIADYRAALKKLAIGDIAVVAGEGRRIEYGKGDRKLVDDMLRELYAEAALRSLPIVADDTGGAIPVEIG